jgi:DNA repair protein RecN (Recombination protein N)
VAYKLPRTGAASTAKPGRTARAELLHYQLKELNEFNPQPGEFEQIDEEYKRLANSGQLLSTSQHALNLLADGEDANLQSQLYTARQMVTELAGMDASLSGVLTMLEEAAIQVSEASDELRHYCDRLELDPNRCMNLSSVFQNRFRWRVNTTSARSATIPSIIAGRATA